MNRIRILHIGQRKTATTWLQKMAEDTARAGLLGFEHWGIAQRFKDADPRAATAADIAGRFGDLPSPDDLPSLVSLEDLIAFDAAALAEAVSGFWPDVRVLITTRAPQDYLLSSFNNDSFARGDSAERFVARFFRNHMQRVFAFDAITDAWAERLGPGRVTFLPYELLSRDRAAYLERIEALLGFSLRPFIPVERLNVSPPPEYLVLQRRCVAMIAEQAPDVLRTRDWQQFSHMTNFSVGEARERLAGYFSDFFAANPLPDGSMPRLDTEQIATLASGMSILRKLPEYQPFLSLYGLPPIPETSEEGLSQ